MFAFLMRIHLMTLHEVREETAVCSIQTDKTHSTTRFTRVVLGITRKNDIQITGQRPL